MFLKQVGGMNLAIDPIFKISVNEADAKYRSGYNGKMYYFCAACSKNSLMNIPKDM
jgi:YHS domain-containing protein